MGVVATEVLDQVFASGALVEKTYDWYAQDIDGNVWYLGEDTKEYENGQVVSTEGSWEWGHARCTSGDRHVGRPHRPCERAVSPGIPPWRRRGLRSR